MALMQHRPLRRTLARASNATPGTPPKQPPVATLDLALQGGCALSAYTGGVLSAILRWPDVAEGRLIINRISGASGGAILGSIITHALNMTGNPLHAADELDKYWKMIIEAQTLSADTLLTCMLSASFRAATLWINPYSTTALSIAQGATADSILKKHRRILEEIITHPEYLHQGPVRLYVSAVEKIQSFGPLSAHNVKPIIFSGEDLDIESILASTALEEGSPIRINGIPYWDPVFHPSANPSLEPLQGTRSSHKLIVTLDDEDLHASNHNRNIVYGHIHQQTGQIPGAAILSLTHGEGWLEDKRVCFTEEFLADLYAKGYKDGLAWIRDFEQYHLVLPPITPEAHNDPDRQVA